MATNSIILNLGGATPPDGSTNNLAPQPSRVKSTAAAPAIHMVEYWFDPTNVEYLYWQFRMPADYASGLVAKIGWKANVTTGNVVWAVRVAAITPGDVDTPNEKAMAAANSATTAVNATEARRQIETSITLSTDDGVAAGDFVVICLYRDSANASDTVNSNDVELNSFSLEYTTT